jgi:hypothetical protein
MPVATQFLPIPDVGAGTGPWASAWIPGTLSSLTRAGMAVATGPADLCILLVSATGADPINEANPNQVGYFYGGNGSQSAPELGLQAAAFYAIIRYPPPKGTKGPTAGAQFELQGT